MTFIKITPEGYTPDGKWRVVPLSATEKMLDAQELIASCSAGFAGAIRAAPPPPAEMLVDERMDAMKTELAFLEDWLNYAADGSLLDVTEAMSSRHRELSEKLTAATASTGEKQ